MKAKLSGDLAHIVYHAGYSIYVQTGYINVYLNYVEPLLLQSFFTELGFPFPYSHPICICSKSKMYRTDVQRLYNACIVLDVSLML